MAHDVFVSYPNVDKATADAVVNTLESNGIRCWVAPRDVPHGVDWAGAIVEAIGLSRMLVLVFSDGTNQSDHILREVRAAGDADIPIVPFRTTEAEPTPALKYYIGGTHWLDAMSGPMEDHLATLVTTVERMLSDEEPPERPKPARAIHTVGVADRPWWSRIPRVGWAGIGAAALVLVVGIGVLVSGGEDETGGNGDVTTTEATDSGGDATTTMAGTTTVVEGDQGSGMSAGESGTAGEIRTSLVPSLLAVATEIKEEGDIPTRVCEINPPDITCLDFPVGPDEQVADIALGDMDGDGLTDVVLATANAAYTGPASNKWCRNLGDGAWECIDWDEYQAQSYPSREVMTADFDADGNLDLLFGNDASRSDPAIRARAEMCLGDGAGGFMCGHPWDTVYDRGVGTNGMDIADLDGDGDLDVLLVGWTFSEACFLDRPGLDLNDTIRTNSGDDSPYTCVELDPAGTHFMSVVASEFDGDDDIEVFLGGGDTAGRFCEFDLATRTFDCADAYPAGADALASVATDFDSLNGGADLVFTASEVGSPAQYCYWSEHGADPSCRTMFELGFPRGAVDLVQNDLNADGIPDVMVIGGMALEACFGVGDGTFTCESISEAVFEPATASYEPWAIDWAPLTRSRPAEVAAAPTASIEKGVVLTSSDGTVVCDVDGDDLTCDQLDRPSNANDAAVADFNGDGELDVAIANYYWEGDEDRGFSTFDRVCLGTGSGYECSDLDDGEHHSSGVVAADVDRDGFVDLVVIQTTLLQVDARARVCWGDGSGTFACQELGEPQLPGGGGEGGEAGIADLDGDGSLDIAIPVHGWPDLVCLGGTGREFDCSEVNERAPDRPNSMWEVAVADFDETGYPDLLFASRADQYPEAYGSEMILCRNSGFGSFTCTEIPGTNAPNNSVAAADLNGDGRYDFVIGRGDPGDWWISPDGPADKNADIVCFGTGGGIFDCRDLPGFGSPTDKIALTVEGYVAVWDDNLIVCPITGPAGDCRAWGRPEQLREGMTSFALFEGGE